MDYTNVIQAISTVGFPIVCCGALFYYITCREKSFTEERTAFTDAINRNTEIMVELKSILETKVGTN